MSCLTLKGFFVSTEQRHDGSDVAAAPERTDTGPLRHVQLPFVRLPAPTSSSLPTDVTTGGSTEKNIISTDNFAIQT